MYAHRLVMHMCGTNCPSNNTDFKLSAGKCCYRYVVDICVMRRGPWAYLECLRGALDVEFEEEKARMSTVSQCGTSDLLKISSLE